MNRILKLTLPVLFFCATVLSAGAQQNTVAHNGHWWNQKSQVYHEGFVIGYKEGMHKILGHDSDLAKFGYTELVIGVDKFYKDFRNQNINIADALPYVGDQLRGIADDKLAAELLKMRAAAASAPNPE
jgi:hypothetical protein